jgi:DNA repair photolyase
MNPKTDGRSMQTLKFVPVGLPCGEKGPSKLYTTNLFSGACPHACVYCYAKGFRYYSDGEPKTVPLEAIKSVKQWPRRLFLSSASDPFHPLTIELAEELLRRALAEGAFVVISTKALATPEVVEILSQYPEQISYTVSLSSLNEVRNRLLEPNAPNAKERFHGRKNNGRLLLCGIEHLTRIGLHVTLKADALFPSVDDTDESILQLLEESRACGVQGINFSYAFFRQSFKSRLSDIPMLRDALAQMNERQPIASGTGFSLPLDEKMKRLTYLTNLAKQVDFKVISTCACKNAIENIPGDVGMQLDCHFHDKWF